MNRAGLTSAQKDLRKELIFSYVVTEQLRQKTAEYNKATVNKLHRLNAGQIIRK